MISVSSVKIGIMGLLTAAVLVVALSEASPALATEAPWWQLSSSSRPTYLQPGREAKIVVQATNLGDAAVNATETPVMVVDELPPGLKAIAVSGISGSNHTFSTRGNMLCATRNMGDAAECNWAGPEPLEPYEQIEMTISVEVQADAQAGAENVISVAGGRAYRCDEVEGTGQFASDFCKVNEESENGTGDFTAELGATVPGLSIDRQIFVSNGQTPFGVEDYELALENEGGSPDMQAGSHPFQVTTSIGLNDTSLPSAPPALAKDLRFDLPPGLIGNATNLAQCNEVEFSTIATRNTNLCPADTQMGVAMVTVEFTSSYEFQNKPTTYVVPIFNLTPSPGEPARFGFEVQRVPVFIDTAIRSGSDYGIVAEVKDVTQVDAFLSDRVSFWGVPGDQKHDGSRGWSCVAGGAWRGTGLPPCAPGGDRTQSSPFMTLPTSCTGDLQTSVQADSWAAPDVPAPAPLNQEPMESLTGCNRLPFSASISVSPDVQSGSTPTGLKVDVHVPQEASLNPAGVSGSDVKDITVTLPKGMTLNPAGADGLQACGESQIGFMGINAGGTDEFTATLPEPLEPGLNLGSLGFCPNASKVGTAKFKLPVLAHPLEGSIYLASQNENPFGSLIAMYIVAEDPVSGVLVKLPGEVSLNPVTGQISTTFKNTPQAPFEDAELHFFGGERAPLATPANCGTYTTNASFTPWSGNAPVSSQSSFEIKTGPNGGPCPNGLPFAPTLAAGSTSNQASSFSPLTTTITREDGQQNIQQVTLHMPRGLSGVLAGVALCPEAQANAGTCGHDSLIGHTIVSVGLGGDPYSVTGGEVFLTEKYEGAPFGLSIVNPAVAGPFNLGKVIVRAKIEIDPHTAQVTITTGEIPHILDGIPLQIKHVNVSIDRPGFTFNPTSCEPMHITGTVGSVEGASAAVSTPFQVTNCAALAFKPQFAVSTQAKTSRVDGASLSVKLSYPAGSFGKDANIAKVKVDLPKQLPSRLSTLQKACPDYTFDANPAACSAASRVGTATATTPILATTLSGPAYFVSYAGLKFPELIVVLSGDGVTVDLHGETFISKAGITSSTFREVPDVPIGTFELTLPEGPDSALAAPGGLCKGSLAMPTAFTAQNGAVIKQSTPITVIGCKPTLSVIHRSASGHGASITVHVPAAGKLTATGPYVASATKQAGKAGAVTLALSISKKGRALLKHHSGRKLTVAVKLLFTPARGHTLSDRVMVLIG
ncbi:MAG TPA: hypothetical protein VK730_02325 [Solirubrobacteraceae bacterium]|nr:hypothetical protein [Solirubrobacteraceae bacterium]